MTYTGTLVRQLQIYRLSITDCQATNYQTFMQRNTSVPKYRLQIHQILPKRPEIYLRKPWFSHYRAAEMWDFSNPTLYGRHVQI